MIGLRNNKYKVKHTNVGRDWCGRPEPDEIGFILKTSTEVNSSDFSCYNFLKVDHVADSDFLNPSVEC